MVIEQKKDYVMYHLFTNDNIMAFQSNSNLIENFQVMVSLSFPTEDRSSTIETNLSVTGQVSIPMSLVTDYKNALFQEFKNKITIMNKRLSLVIKDKYFIQNKKRINLPQDISIDDFKIVSPTFNRINQQFKKPEIEDIDISSLIDTQIGLEIYNRKTSNTVYEYCVDEEGNNIYGLSLFDYHSNQNLARKASLVKFFGFRCNDDQKGYEALGLIFNWLVKNQFVDHATMVCGRVGDGEEYRYLLFVCSKNWNIPIDEKWDLNSERNEINNKLGYQIEYVEGMRPHILDFDLLKQQIEK